MDDDTAGSVLTLVLWVTGMREPFEYTMLDAPYKRCMSYAIRLAIEASRMFDVDVTAQCIYRATLIG